MARRAAGGKVAAATRSLWWLIRTISLGTISLCQDEAAVTRAS